MGKGKKQKRNKAILIVMLLILSIVMLNNRNDVTGEHISRWEHSPLVECVAKCPKGYELIEQNCGKTEICSEGRVRCRSEVGAIFHDDFGDKPPRKISRGLGYFYREGKCVFKPRK